MDGKKRRKGGAERERLKRRKALATGAAKCCKISDMFTSKGPDIVQGNPQVRDFLESWPALRMESREQHDVNMRCTLALRALSVYLCEDDSEFFKTCNWSHVRKGLHSKYGQKESLQPPVTLNIHIGIGKMSQILLSLLTVVTDNTTGEVHFSPESISVVVEDEIVDLGDTASNEGTDASTASAAVLVDPEQEAFSPLAPQPPPVLHCGSQCNLKPFHHSSAYASALVESVRERDTPGHQRLYESSAVLSSTAPASLSRSCQKINKDEGVGLYLARHLRFNRTLV